MSETTRMTPTALVTGGSRGIGAATVIALAVRGYDVAFTYRNKASRAQDVVSLVQQRGQQSLAVGCDITQEEERSRLFKSLSDWRPALQLLILNASGGLEREALAADPDYPMHINRDAQVALVDEALPFMAADSTIVFITSHWAHLYGRAVQIPAYEPVAASKYAGEMALRARQNELEKRGIRLLVVTGDLIADTITPKLLERSAPGLAANRVEHIGALPTATEMGEIIASAATEAKYTTGETIVVGGTLESLLSTPGI